MAYGETLVLGTPSTSRVRYDECRQHPTRLITPDGSRGSARSNNSSSPSSVVRRGAPVHDLLLPRTPETTVGRSEAGQSMSHSRRDSFHDPLPKPNDQRLSDQALPSLPPLKQLFGSNISSPPDTPHPFSAGGQPLPCEPAYTTSTYKPPALYPSKRPRTDIPLDANKSLRSPVCQPVHLPRVETSSERWASDSRTRGSPPRNHDGGIRTSRDQHRSSVSMESRRIHGQDGTNGLTRSGYGQPSYRTPEHTPTSTHFDMDHYTHRPDMDMSRRSSTNSFAGYDSRVLEGTQSSQAYQQGPRYPMSHRDSRVQGPEDHPMEGYAPGPYHLSQTPYFVPSHYEYQHGKARKRSNLPKRSTDIMKTWFDQNIQNPYPSEEQKVMFSNATGISMTQVSNWFINHRRRCPELRDKRDKGRSRDCDM